MGSDFWPPMPIPSSSEPTPHREVVPGGSRPSVAARHVVRLQSVTAHLAFRVSGAGLPFVVSRISVQSFHILPETAVEESELLDMPPGLCYL